LLALRQPRLVPSSQGSKAWPPTFGRQIEYCIDDARAWDLITDRLGWDATRLYAFQDDVKKFADLIGRAKGRVERARPGATAHHNLNMLISHSY